VLWIDGSARRCSRRPGCCERPRECETEAHAHRVTPSKLESLPVRRRGLALALVALAAAGSAVAANPKKSAVPTLLFPVAGATTYQDDFGQPRSDGPPHQGNDLLAAKKTPAIAVESGKVKFWTTSATAGCMLYLYGDSGTMYEYIHLNNDVTMRNDNRGKCVAGTSYAKGLKDGQHVTAGQQIGYVGDSGDANGIHPHLHFEVHPNGGAAVDPFRYLKRAPHLLAPAPPDGKVFTLKISGSVVASTPATVTMSVGAVASWPSHVKQTNFPAKVTITLTGGETFKPGERIVAWTEPSPGTLDALTGAAGALSLEKFAARS